MINLICVFAIVIAWLCYRKHLKVVREKWLIEAANAGHFAKMWKRADDTAKALFHDYTMMREKLPPLETELKAKTQKLSMLEEFLRSFSGHTLSVERDIEKQGAVGYAINYIQKIAERREKWQSTAETYKAAMDNFSELWEHAKELKLVEGEMIFATSKLKDLLSKYAKLEANLSSYGCDPYPRITEVADDANRGVALLAAAPHGDEASTG